MNYLILDRGAADMDTKQESKLKKEDSEQELLQKALTTLHKFITEKAAQAGWEAERGESLWRGIRQSNGLLRELAYYHDYGKFLCEYKVAGYTLADVLVWQVDHFKLYMDRHEEMNRYRQERLLLEAFEAMVGMERDPAPFVEKMRSESGQDAAND